MKGPAVDVFQALADPPRRSILLALGKKEKSIRGIAEGFPQSRNAIVKHLAVLKAAALVEAYPQGLGTVHRLLPGPLDDVKKWLGYFDAFWDERLAKLKWVAEAEAGLKEGAVGIPKKGGARRPWVRGKRGREESAGGDLAPRNEVYPLSAHFAIVPQAVAQFPWSPVARNFLFGVRVFLARSEMGGLRPVS